MTRKTLAGILALVLVILLTAPMSCHPFDGNPRAQNYEWLANTGEEFTEHSVIYGGNLFVPACDYTNKNGGVKKYSLSGELQATYAAITYTQCTPILATSGGDGDCMWTYDLLNRKINRTRLSDNTITHYDSFGDAIHYLDFESMGWDTVNSRIIALVYIVGDAKWYLQAYNMADLSIAWSYEISLSGIGSVASPLVVGNYTYWSNYSNGVLYKLNLSDGTLADSVDLGDNSEAISYASPIYDPDNGDIYCISTYNKVHAVDPSDMSEVWNHTFAAGSGSDTDYITYTGMTTPLIHSATGYHSGKVFITIREEASSSNQYKAKLYAINASSGHKAWVNLSAWNINSPSGARVDHTSMLLTDDHIVVPGLDYNTVGNLNRGWFFIIAQSDGTELVKGALACYPMCGGATQAYAGRVFFNEGNGLIECIKLGWGATNDSIHYMKNSYHNGYTNNLVVDTNLTYSTCSSTITGRTEDEGKGKTLSQGVVLYLSELKWYCYRFNKSSWVNQYRLATLGLTCIV